MFMRAPRLGQVKTRLSRHLERGLVLDLYRLFVLDTLETVALCESESLVFVDPPAATAEVDNWLEGRFSCVGQEGKDLGERMAKAFGYAFSHGFWNAVLIGSDTPDLPRTIIDASINQLQNNDAVIGPSTDGGYYLIGFSTRNIPADVFNLPIWGTESVFSDTISVLSLSGCAFHVLPEWSDIDQPYDLKRFLSDPGLNLCGRRTRAWAFHHRAILEEALARSGGHRAP
jgi:uncharacterized protein